MALSKETKNVVIAKYGKDNKDTGNSQVQIALLSKRISALTEHLKKNKHDVTASRSLRSLVGRRRKLLTYLSEYDHDAYEELIASLGLKR